ncbi:MAG: chitinase [Acidimicrobiales bacterium]|jgi:chitinase
MPELHPPAAPRRPPIDFEEEPARRLSPFRIMLAFLLVAGAAYGTFIGIGSRLNRAAASSGLTWFAPYVDVTLTPTYTFQIPASDPAPQTVLGFVVSDPAEPCTPSWGGAYTLDQADQSLALGARVAEMSQQGALAIVSFGGQANDELAVRCTDIESLTRAYEQVIDRYHIRAIDFDIEGAALDNLSATDRRAAAIKNIQAHSSALKSPLEIWLTLPVEPSGLQDNAITVIDRMLAARVDLAGVNLLAMDFARPTGNMLGDIEKSASAAEAQIAAEMRRYGVIETDAHVWQRMGVTVMIGQNDVAGERFSVTDAQGLVGFAQRVRLGRVSMWSLNRDVQCGSTFPQIGVNSNTCSGTTQAGLQFSRIFGELAGTVPMRAVGAATPPQPDTNPADAPFPMWSPDSAYQTGYKVVRGGYIYEAKWYNAGQDPAEQVQYSWQTPWELLGPVLPGDKAPTIATLPAGTYRGWSSTQNYTAGQDVMYNGLGYQAKWANQGASPADAIDDPAGSPWSPLYSIPGEPGAS